MNQDILVALVKHVVKASIAGLLYYSGTLHLIKRRRLHKKALVLAYHRILPRRERLESFSHDAIIVDPGLFARHIDFLRKHFTLLDISEFSKHLLDNHKLPPNTCLITFDDGWKDNYTHAFPILRDTGTPAVIFLPVDYIGTGDVFWQEAMGATVAQLFSTQNSKSSEMIERLGLSELSGLPLHDRNRKIIQYVREIKDKPYSELLTMAAEITSCLGKDHPASNADSYLDWEEIRLMEREGNIRFGSHACSHRVLTRLSEKEIENEASVSKSTIESHVTHPVDTIAYPNGDSDKKVQQICNHTGYRVGFGTKAGFVSGKDNVFDLKRINMNERSTASTPMLFATILGIF